jgi:hypothetical protein
MNKFDQNKTGVQVGNRDTKGYYNIYTPCDRNSGQLLGMSVFYVNPVIPHHFTYSDPMYSNQSPQDCPGMNLGNLGKIQHVSTIRKSAPTSQCHGGGILGSVISLIYEEKSPIHSHTGEHIPEHPVHQKPCV